MSETLSILCVGDVVGKPGRQVLNHHLARIQDTHKIDMTIVNVENMAGGKGISMKTYMEVDRLEIDVYTTGNHVFDKKEALPQFSQFTKLIRPLNLPPGSPGVGTKIVTIKGTKVAVVNVMGRVFMPLSDCPFQALQRVIPELKKEANVIIVDCHAEATSEKLALARMLDGKVSCLYGTHTHVMTADERISKLGTASICDIGMTGGRDGIIGMEGDPILQRFITQLPAKFEPCSTGGTQLNAIKLVIDTVTGKALSISRILEVL